MNQQASSVRRIFKEWRGISERTREVLARGGDLAWGAHPVQREQPHEWHFTIRGPAGSAFESGMYHGKLILPAQYPMQPPSIYFLTMNGRFDVGKPICLTVTQYHPEEWQPAWGIASILDALQAFLPTPSESAANSLDWSDRTRQQLAAQSINYRCPTCEMSNKELLTNGHPFIDDDDHPAGSPQQSPFLQESPPDTAEARDSQSTLLDDYTIWSSIPLLFWYLLLIVARSLSAHYPAAGSLRWDRRRLVKVAFIFTTSAFCLYKIYSTLSAIARDVWILADFPIHRPGQMTTMGDNFRLTRAETTEAFPIHPWLMQA